ncbi:MAG: agmatinase, partial [bacterium]
HAGARHALPLLKRIRKILGEKVKKVITDGKIPVVIGGEHSVSLAPIEAAAAIYPELTVVQFDAHADLRSEYNGSPYSHASVIRRVLELPQPPRRVIQIGIRSMCPEEIRFVRDSGKVTILWGKDITADDAGRHLRMPPLKKITGKVYITIDMDAFDPSEVPAVGTPEPGGIRWHQAVDILSVIIGSADVVGFDVVELAPLRDGVASQFLAAKLIYRIMGLIERKQRT